MIEGATVSDMPLYCIPISGITPGAPILLYNHIPSMWDSITRTGWTQAAPSGWWQWGKTDDPHLYVAKWGEPPGGAPERDRPYGWPEKRLNGCHHTGRPAIVRPNGSG